MARPIRTWHSAGYYHITIRGNNRQNIFHGASDVNEYYRILTYVYGKYQFEIYAFCIMNNHNHLLLRSYEAPLGKLMAIVNKRYSDYFRKKYNYTGQIYESRYFSKEIGPPTGLLNVSAYIHQNPLETKIPIVQAMEQYLYSSYQYYYHDIPSPFPFLNLHLLPRLMPVEKQKLKAYTQYCIQYKPVENPASELLECQAPKQM
ncbi:transposase [Lederbergia lenta]|uniref:Putative transposase n=1 Tax=Lederbergia lenta TaxID=1467 RepID=A0A2X4WD42_LEDLE|nr:transposase [Lederbergia lenta]MEC2323069.1 transposase [Lederbergia lenta]SQI62627.1 putative transposase [Lederbergia lenta]